MNNIYIYDNNFSSLILLIFKIIEKNDSEFSIKSKDNYRLNFLDKPIYLNLNIKDLKLIKEKLSNNILKTCYYVYFSNEVDKELIIYNFIKEALKYKNSVYYQRNINSVNEAVKIQNYVSRELHKYKGFLRFKKMKNNFYYAEITPTNNILILLSRHFTLRFYNENFIIKDKKRNLYAVYLEKKNKFLKESDIKQLNIILSNDELQFEDLWKAFFNKISIKERKNLRCQMNNMPKKYWKDILEMEDRK